MLTLTLVPLVFLTLVSIRFSQLGLLPGLPTDSTVGGEWSWVGVRHRRATVQKRPYTEGGDTLVLFLCLLVAVTGACFLHLGDPYEAADSYGGWGENKGEKKEWNEDSNSNVKQHWAFSNFNSFEFQFFFPQVKSKNHRLLVNPQEEDAGSFFIRRATVAEFTYL